MEKDFLMTQMDGFVYKNLLFVIHFYKFHNDKVNELQFIILLTERSDLIA